MLTSTMVKSVCTLAGVVVLATGCAQSMAGPMSGSDKSMTAASATPAASLRVALNSLLGEHVILAAAATGAALDGREAEFKAAAGALDANSVDIAKAIGSVYGKDAEQAFLPLWRRHIGFFLDCTVGVATKDTAKRDKAVGDLIGYTQDFGAFLQAANPTPRPRRIRPARTRPCGRPPAICRRSPICLPSRSSSSFPIATPRAPGSRGAVCLVRRPGTHPGRRILQALPEMESRAQL
jgi:hypothetical protein